MIANYLLGLTPPFADEFDLRDQLFELLLEDGRLVFREVGVHDQVDLVVVESDASTFIELKYIPAGRNHPWDSGCYGLWYDVAKLERTLEMYREFRSRGFAVLVSNHRATSRRANARSGLRRVAPWTCDHERATARDAHRIAPGSRGRCGGRTRPPRRKTCRRPAGSRSPAAQSFFFTAACRGVSPSRSRVRNSACGPNETRRDRPVPDAARARKKK